MLSFKTSFSVNILNICEIYCQHLYGIVYLHQFPAVVQKIHIFRCYLVQICIIFSTLHLNDLKNYAGNTSSKGAI